MTIRCGVLDDALQRADMESARRGPSSADEGRKPTSSRQSKALGGDGRVCLDRRDHQASFPRHGRRASRCDAALVRPGPGDEVVREPACSPSLRWHRVHTEPSSAITTSEPVVACVVSCSRSSDSITRSVALGASGGWCLSTPTILRRLRLGPTAVNLVYTRSVDVVAHVQATPASRKSQDRAARRRRQCPKARPSAGSKRSAEH